MINERVVLIKVLLIKFKTFTRLTLLFTFIKFNTTSSIISNELPSLFFTFLIADSLTKCYNLKSSLIGVSSFLVELILSVELTQIVLIVIGTWIMGKEYMKRLFGLNGEISEKAIGEIRTLADIIFVILGIMLGAYISIGTVLASLFMDISIQCFVIF